MLDPAGKSNAVYYDKDMRKVADEDTVLRFLSELGRRATSPGVVYLVGGTSAVMYGWRASTVDIDLKLDPEPQGAFSAIGKLKNQLDVNVELASPDHFIPAVPGWRERSPSLGTFGHIRVHHYDLLTQALAKIERGSARDVIDVRAMLRDGHLDIAQIRDGYAAIVPMLERYPALDADRFDHKVEAFCEAYAAEADAQDDREGGSS